MLHHAVRDIGNRVLLLPVLFAAALGLIAAMSMEFTLYPRQGQHQVVVRTSYPDVEAAQVDQLVTRKLSDALQLLDEVEQLYSVSTRGSSSIYIRLAPGTSIHSFRQMAYHRIDELKHLLPPDIQTPSLHCGSADSTAVFSAAFPVDALEDSEKFSRLAEGLEGVDQVIAPFRTSSIIHAELYRDQALAAGINPSTIRLLLQDRFRRYQIGLGSNPAGDTLTLSPALLSDNIPLPAEMHSLLHFSPGEKRNSRIERVDGIPQQVVTIFADPGKNIIGLCARLEQYAGSFPSARIMFNRGRYLSNVLSATFIAVALGVAAVILCLSLQTGGFTAAMFALLGGLPLSLGTSLVVLKACGLGLHMMSLAGIAAASGLLIDTAVVFFEHCNSDPSRQVLHGAARPISVATATTLVVCIPVLLLPYGIRREFIGFTAVFISALGTGWIWTLAALPRLLSDLPYNILWQYRHHERYRRIMQLTSLFRQHPLCGCILLVLFQLGCIPIFQAVDFSPYPEVQTGSLNVRFEFPSMYTARSIDELLFPLCAHLRSIPGVESTAASCSSGSASVRICIGNAGIIDGIERLIRSYSEHEAVSVLFEGSSRRSEGVQILLYGRDSERLHSLILDAGRKISAGLDTSGIYFRFKDPAPYYRIVFQSEPCAFYRVDPAAAAGQMRILLSGSPSAKYQDNREKDVVLVDADRDPLFSSYFNNYLFESGGKIRRLANFALLQEDTRFETLERRRGALFTGMTVVPEADRSPTELWKELRHILQTEDLPPGYHFEVGPDIRELQIEKSVIVCAIVLAALLVFLILYSYYRNTRYTLFAVLHIPPAIAFSLYALRIAGTAVSIPVLTAVLVTVGVSINNIVILLPPPRIDPVPDLLLRLSWKMSSIQTSTITTVAGIAPLLFGGISNSGLPIGFSIVIAAGAVGSFLTLPITCAVGESFLR